MSERDLEVPEADAAEQDAEVAVGVADDEISRGDGDLAEVPIEVDPADRAEQLRSVDLANEDDYR